MSSLFHITIVIGMLVFGSVNILISKFVDRQFAPGSNDGQSHLFQHPFLQAFGMFIGEFFCLIMYKIWVCWQKLYSKMEDIEIGNQDFHPIILMAPAMVDLLGSSLMFIGLNYTYASSLQMLRGSIVVFTALLSTAFLGRLYCMREWGGMAAVIAGLILVGVSDVVFVSDEHYGVNEVLTGDMIIVIAQITGAVQMVLEEKFVRNRNIHPLQAVGWEGFFGMTILGVLLVPMYFIPAGEFSGNPRGVLEDALDGLYQMGHNNVLLAAMLGSIFSISFVNYFGLSITVAFSATTRLVLDSARTIVIWVVSLALQWEVFQYLQIIGFLIMVSGMLVYHNVIPTRRHFCSYKNPLQQFDF